MDISVKISGIARVGDTLKNIVLNTNNPFEDKSVKEVMYSTEFGEVEALFGFTDLNIVEINDNSKEVHAARIFLRDDERCQGVIFLRDGFLIITDLLFFSAYTVIDGKETTYTTSVDTDTYEDEEAIELIENDNRLE